jgi:ATP-dependent phosphofructokinase / diphosphate-dependent phosphofructokinase
VGSVTHAIDALHSTAEAHARVMAVEVMGRNAGWIALHAGVAGGADAILIPEIPYRIERVAAKIREREGLGLRFSIVVIAEGAKPVGQKVLEVEAARPGLLPRLGGAGSRLVEELEALKLGHEVRLTVLGHLQRGGSPTAFDRMLGTQMGTHAAALCSESRYGRMVAWRDGRVTSIALPPEDRLHKLVDPRGSLATSARALGIELGA